MLVTEPSLTELLEKARKDVRRKGTRSSSKGPAVVRRRWQRNVGSLLYHYGDTLTDDDLAWLSSVTTPTPENAERLHRLERAASELRYQRDLQCHRDTIARLRRLGLPVPADLAIWERGGGEAHG
jgi:hypothetical protein